MYFRRRENTDFLLPARATMLGRAVAVLLVGVTFSGVSFGSQRAASPPASSGAGAQEQVEEPTLYIREFRVTGAHKLRQIEVEKAVYPYLGPGRTAEDVEAARAALEAAYHEQGYQTVSVQVPPQQARRGIVSLTVVEGKVGRLRVKGSRYFDLEQIKRHAPSMAEGNVPNFNDITRDILALNQLPDRRVTPELRAGVEPGTVDIDLNVKDKLPLHGSLELNNRYSADTAQLRLNGSLSYSNLWQLGHSLGFSFQISPEDLEQVKIFSAYYLAKFPNLPSFSLLLQGTKQNSNVSTLGGQAVAGNGEVVGIRGIVVLPSLENFYESLSFGVDYKRFDQDITLGTTLLAAPITYYPVSIYYNGSWIEKTHSTDLSAGVTFSFRGAGSDEAEFDSRRYNSSGGFIYFRGDLAHTHDLPFDFQAFAKVQGQLTAQPLIDSEQFSGGGLGTVRGYLESEVLGDNGGAGTLELRSPSLLAWLGDKNKWLADKNEWRLYVFADGAILGVNDPLPEQESHFELASIGFGSRIRLFDFLNGSLDAGWPLISQTQTHAHDLLLTFRVWAQF